MGAPENQHEFLPMALVDVELLVSMGAPRTAFAVRGGATGLPTFELDVSALRRLGWSIGDHSLTPPGPLPAWTELPPHCYALSTIWEGGNCWQATFGEGVRGVVDHQWCIEPHDPIDAGPPLASKSPWRWLFVSGDQRVAGRAESPLQAAAAVESLARVHGAVDFAASPAAPSRRT